MQKIFQGTCYYFETGEINAVCCCLFQIGETLPNSLLSLFAVQEIINPIPFNLSLYKLGNMMWWSRFVKWAQSSKKSIPQKSEKPLTNCFQNLRALSPPKACYLHCTESPPNKHELQKPLLNSRPGRCQVYIRRTDWCRCTAEQWFVEFILSKNGPNLEFEPEKYRQ